MMGETAIFYVTIVWQFKWKLPWGSADILRLCMLTFKSVNKSLVFEHLNESYWAILSCGTLYCALQGGTSF